MEFIVFGLKTVGRVDFSLSLSTIPLPFRKLAMEIKLKEQL